MSLDSRSSIQHFIYPLSKNSGYVFNSSKGITPDNYWADALKGRVDEWGLSNGFRLVEAGDWVWAYFGGSVRQICGVGEVIAVGWRPDWGRHTVNIRWNPALTKRLKDNPISYDSYQQQVQGAAVRASPSTIRVLNRWLNHSTLPTRTDPRDVKFARQDVQRRLGQPQFRAEVLKAFGGACAVTGCREDAVLQAAHIRAVSLRGRHSVVNSILLRADLHNLFDLGLLSIDQHLVVHVDPGVQERPYRALEGRKATPPLGVSKTDWARALAVKSKAR